MHKCIGELVSIFVGAGLLLSLSACGYRLAGRTINTSAGIQSLAVPTLVNKTTLQEVEQLLTRALIEQVSERTTLRVSSQENGTDAVLHGEITAFSAAPVIFGAESFASTFLVTIQVSVRITKDGGKKILFENPNYIFRDQYVIHSDVKQFFSEQNPALQRIARDFAASIITTFLNSL